MTQGVWLPVDPASEVALERLQEKGPLRLPPEYIDQLAASDGGEGDLGVQPGWIVLWPADEVLAHNAGYSVSEFLPGFFGFGSNGGGELLAFDIRGSEPYPIVMVPVIPMEVGEAVRIASSFGELRNQIGKLSKSDT